ncbi:FAD-dependent oxidoreductase [Dethiothermospora halolimnae]|uniref:FAD-dependent oxidoreductase n=1 Tax=Dethiothermospora halolimnae TaxID=3114390 RepID=UPI003CCB94BF
MAKIVVIGGGWAGCAAAISAKKAGAEVTLIERTDLLLGLGNVGGVMRNNGRYTATEECILLGGRELFEITDKYARHKEINFPGHKHASTYDIDYVESAVRSKLSEMGIDILFETKAVDADIKDDRINYIILDNKKRIYGDSFIETTGSTGPISNCYKYGNGCVMCVLRCPTYGGRVSITEKLGIKDMVGKRKDGTYGSFSGSIKILKKTLSDDLQKKLNKDGVLIVPLPKKEINSKKLDIKVCRQYAIDDFSKNIIVIDTGEGKVMAPFYPLDKLRKIKGFERVRFKDPYSAGIGNSIRHFSAAPRDDFMKVIGVDNLFVAGEKSGFYIGHTEAITTGYLAGYNGVRKSIGTSLLKLPSTTVIGDMISYSNKIMNGKDGDKMKFTFAGADYFERMKSRGLYTTDKEELYQRIRNVGLIDVFDNKIVY